MFHGSSVSRLVAFAGSLMLSALIVCQTTGFPLDAARVTSASFATVA